MWKSAQYVDSKCLKNEDNDDWETDPDFVNDVTEEDQRWGSKTVEGSGRTAAAIDLNKLRNEVNQEDEQFKEKFAHQSQKDLKIGFGGKFGLQKDRVDKSAVGFDYHEKLAAHASQKDYATGFGGKFGVQKDRVDKSAVGWEYHEKVDKHESQKDYSLGFGGKFGVQKDRVDKSAVGWEHHEKIDKHESQKDYSVGFGGKFGVQKDRVDKSAVGWEHHEKVDKHESQKDYSLGFGGKFGVQKDRVDKSALGWEHHEKLDKHESQKDYSVGFGGKFGVQKDRVDKSAVGWDHHETVEKHSSQIDASKGFGGKFGVESDRKDKSAHRWEDKDDQSEEQTKMKKTEIIKSDAKSLLSKFENLAKQDEINMKEKIEAERQKRLNQEKLEKELNKDRIIFENQAKEDQEDSNSEDPEEEESKRHNGNHLENDSAESTPKNKHFNKIGVSVFPAKSKIETPPPTKAEQNVNETKNTEIDKITEATTTEQLVEEDEEKTELPTITDEMGLTAIALYDYEAAESDEISFDPDELITNIEKIDDGWWRGQCRGKVGLFPANYVKLNE